MTIKRIVQGLAALLGLILLAGVAAVAFVATADLRPLIEHRVSASLDRKVTADSLEIGWGNPIRLQI